MIIEPLSSLILKKVVTLRIIGHHRTYRKRTKSPGFVGRRYDHSMCSFCFSRNLDPIGSSFRSNAFDKILTSRCPGEKGNSGGKRRKEKTFSDSIGIQKCKLLFARHSRSPRVLCVSITFCDSSVLRRTENIAVLQPIQTIESNLTINGE